MNGNYLLDTNIIIALIGKEKNLLAHISDATAVPIPVIVLGELYFGAYNSTRVENNILEINKLINSFLIIDCDINTSSAYGQIKIQLRSKGKPIPENDIWIAAIAIQYEFTLITRDEHYNSIDGLEIEKW